MQRALSEMQQIYYVSGAGCIHWRVQAQNETVRTLIEKEGRGRYKKNAKYNFLLYFAFFLDLPLCALCYLTSL